MQFEKLDINKHSPQKVAALIYETDRETFDFFYQNQATASQYIEKLVRVGNNTLGQEHVNVVTRDGEVIGILLHSWGQDHHRIRELKVLFRNLNLLDAFRFILIDLKDSLILSNLKKGDFYLAGVAVDEKVRGKGIGGLILDRAVEMARERGCKRVVLDVALDNPGAKRLYGRTGFKVYNKRSFPWFGKKIGMYNMELQL